jgi:hypothetical protein
VYTPTWPTRHSIGCEEPANGHAPDEKGFLHDEPQLQRLPLQDDTLVNSVGRLCMFASVAAS